jgi:hypothetical protein
MGNNTEMHRGDDGKMTAKEPQESIATGRHDYVWSWWEIPRNGLP